MKQKILFYLFLLIGIISLNASCDKDDPANPIDQLPPLTNTGINKAGCLVNGQPLLPTGGGSIPNMVCFYQEIDGEKYFSLGFFNNQNNPKRNVAVFTNKLTLIQGNTYQLNKIQDNSLGGGGELYIDLDIFNTNTLKTGELKITYLNEAQQIVSGTFWFDAVNEQGETVQVREGRFDVTYSL